MALPVPELSIVVPLRDEQSNVAPLVQDVAAALRDAERWELILVDDGSRDATAEVATRCAQRDPRIRLLRLARNYGQTTALQAGFDNARGQVVVSMDGDLQNDPADIPRLVAALQHGIDLVAGYRDPRVERGLLRRAPSAVANALIRVLTGVPAKDSGCTLRAYRRTLLDALHLYSDMHRFIPALAVGLAGARMAEIAVRDRPRHSGRSKYGLGRAPGVLADLVTLTLVHSFRERPLAPFVAGAAVAALLAVLAIVSTAVASATASYVLPGAALAWLALAGYLVMLGLVGHIVVHLRHRRGVSRPAVLLRERHP